MTDGAPAKATEPGPAAATPTDAPRGPIVLPIDAPFELPDGTPADFDARAVEDDYGTSHTCDLCQKDMSGQVRVQCAVCDDFDVCVACFCAGRETETHRNDHPYRVWDMLDFAILDKDWAAEEELLLLGGLETYGMGNWEQVAEFVGTKSKRECEAHYTAVFVDSARWPYPDLDVAAWNKQASRRARRPQLLGAARAGGAAGGAQPKAAKPLQSHPHNHEIGGFMPARGEFDEELPDNDAEKAVDVLSFDESDMADETALKLAMLQMYNHTLDRRVRRKSFIFGRRLTNFRHMRSADNRLDKPTRELYLRYRVFSKMMSQSDWEVFIASVQEEKKLRWRIGELQEMRRLGITTREGELLYKEAKREREQYLKTVAADPSAAAAAAQDASAADGPADGVAGLSASSRGSSPLLPFPATKASAAAGVLAGATSAPPLVRTRPAPAALNLENVDGVELLTFQERLLCSNLRVLPRPYLVIKEQLLRENERLGGLRRRQARELISIDVNKTSRIYDFFLEMGWVQLPTSSGGASRPRPRAASRAC